MADNLERRQLRKDQLAAQQAGKRGAAGNFLREYLDPKDHLSGTAFDPMILQGLQDAMSKGAQLAAAGADSPTLMMALGPMVNKLSTYSANAKNINKQVDETINNMKADKQEGYDWAAVKNEALQKAFYKQSADGQNELNPAQADPSVNWVMKAIEDSPEKVTTSEGFDQYFKDAKTNTTLHDITEMDKFGNPTRSKVNLIAQNYLTPEFDKATGKVKGFVPLHDEATEKGQPLYHLFDDGKGGKTKAQVRLLDEKIFDSFRPGQVNYIRGLVKKHLQEYEGATGEKISMDSPKAKMVARALAYDELNRPNRKATNVGYVHNDKLSPQQISLNIQSTDQYLQNVEDKAAASKRGRLSVPSDEESLKGFKVNAAEAIGNIFNGKEDLSQNKKVAIDGTIETYSGGTKDVKNMQVYDITSSMPGGGLKAGRGEDYDFKKIYYSPTTRSLVAEKESGPEGRKRVTQVEIPEANIGQFLYNIAEANGVPKAAVKPLLQKMGFNGGKFNNAVDNSSQLDFEERAKKSSWRKSFSKSPFGPVNK